MSKSSLFDVFLRLRPSDSPNERFLTADTDDAATDPPTNSAVTPADLPRKEARHISIKPVGDDRRKRQTERFEFTRVFQENASQQEVFDGIKVMDLVRGVLGMSKEPGQEGITVGRDALVATLGVTGSGKSHTILGSKTVPGLTQLSLAAIFQATEGLRIEDHTGTLSSVSAFQSLCNSDPSEAHVVSASMFMDTVFGSDDRNRMSRAQTPMGESASFMSLASVAPSSKKQPPRPSTFAPIPTFPPDYFPQADASAEYAIIISMFEVYNDRIFDLLTSSTSAGPANRMSVAAAKRRALLFKSTEQSPDRKVVAGLRKVVCFTLEEALTILEVGLAERKVAGTGSNAVSSRSHGFFSVEVKKREKSARGTGEWVGTGFTIVDLAGSERARSAKTAGATLAEAGKINESLMYLGRCMQMQSDPDSKSIVPFRQCKLTELLFSNSYPSQSSHHNHQQSAQSFVQTHRNPQKAIMIVAADAKGDYSATYQILRYSALARDVTVVRVPSGNNNVPLLSAQSAAGRRHPNSGRLSPAPSSGGGNDRLSPDPYSAHASPSLLHERIAQLTQKLEDEKARRLEAEESIYVLSDRLSLLEEEIREEMAEEMEERVEAERRRWMGAWDEEADRRDEWMDKKVELVIQQKASNERPITSPSGDGLADAAGTTRLKELEQENETFRKRLLGLENKLGSLNLTSGKKSVDNYTDALYQDDEPRGPRLTSKVTPLSATSTATSRAASNLRQRGLKPTSGLPFPTTKSKIMGSTNLDSNSSNSSNGITATTTTIIASNIDKSGSVPTPLSSASSSSKPTTRPSSAASGRTSPAKPRTPASPRKQRVLKAKRWGVEGNGGVEGF